jgi:heterodisulfide reductase subunit A
MDPSLLPLNQSAVVVGGGIAGMTAATSLARQGFETHLIEKKSHLGGNLDYLDKIAPAGHPAQDYLVSAALKLTNEDVHIHLESTVEAVSGYVGNFNLQLNDGCDLEVGALVIATGAAPYSPNEFNYGSDKNVITNLELESCLSNRSVPGDRITFISCVGSRQASTGCSRYCCTATAYQALRLQRSGKSVNIISREVRTYSRQAEELYASAMSYGVRYFRVDPFQPIQESIDYGNGVLDFYDLDFRRKIRLNTDLLVLVVGLQPSSNGLDDQLKLARSEDGFLMELHPKLGPAETASPGIYLAGTVQGSKDVRESVAQGLAAAAKAGSLLSKGVIEKEPLTAKVNLELCNGCMRCVKVCPYGAIEQIGKPGKGGEVRIIEAACMGCGTCAAECNFGAIDMPFFTREQILAQVDAALLVEPGSKCLVFTCNWCSYAGADLAGIEKRQYPTSARVIRTMCSARFEESFVARAFEQGAGAVLITGCRLTETGSDCHYNYANRLTWKRFKYWQRKFRRKGIEAERLQLQWISAAEGKEFAEKITEMDSIVKCHLANNSLKVAEG